MDIIKKIGDYTYNERYCLGEGSFGRVYEGRSDKNARMKVAIKKIEQSMISKDPYLKASLESEITIMKKLNHPNIVKLEDVVTTSNSIYLIMEYCAGGDLKRYCRNRKLTEDEATTIIKHIVRAFQQIVKLGIIHRDLKPANILVHEGIFKICDFGFAKFFTDAARMTRTFVGTPIYMSPQVLCQKHYTDKTDVWSLGILYYELVFGKLPYHGVTEDLLYKNIIRGPLSINNCKPSIQSTIRGMLQIDENKRYSWNKMFQIFQLEQLPQKNRQEVEKIEHQNIFYKQPSINNKNREDYEANLMNQYKQTFANKYNDYEVEEEVMNNIGKKPQKRPINPLAFENPSPLINNLVQQKNQPIVPVNPPQNHKLRKISSVGEKSNQNPRFLYFVLIELIVEPIKVNSYPLLMSSLYKKTVQLYTKFIDRQRNSNTLYVRILTNQINELKAIQSQIPNYPTAQLERSAQAVLKQVGDFRNPSSSLVWVQKILNKNYSYDKF